MHLTNHSVVPEAEIIGSGNQDVILVHGFGMNRRAWYLIAPYLKEHYRLHLLDLVGFGNSTAPARFGYTPDDQATALYHYIQAKQLSNVILVGHSYGGGVVMLCSLILQELEKSALVQKLVLIAPAIYQQRVPFFVSFSGKPIIGPILARLIPPRKVTQYIMRTVYKDEMLANDEQVDKYIDNLQDKKKSVAIYKTSRYMIPPNAELIAERVETIQQPALLVYGDHDRVIVPESMDRLQGAMINVQYMFMESCGHVPHEEYPAELAEAMINFINE